MSLSSFVSPAGAQQLQRNSFCQFVGRQGVAFGFVKDWQKVSRTLTRWGYG